MNEQELCRKRLLDLARLADRRGIVLFSDFLGLNELNIYRQSEKLFETKTESFGGVPCAERQMIAFIPNALCHEIRYPIAALRIKPVNPRFAEPLGHRDVLGAVMNLGIDRGKLGDILICENEAYLLCHENTAEHFLEHLERVRHTAVTAERCQPEEISVRQELEERTGIVTSDRLDALLACVHKLSRSQAQALIRQEKVFVNGQTAVNPSRPCQAGDIVSARGYGRFVYLADYGETGKGRLKIRYQIYRN